MTEFADIKILLKAWARWHCQCHGYPIVCPMMLAQDGSRSGVPASMPPRGVEAPEDVRQVMVAMAALSLGGPDNSRAMAAVKAWYLRSHRLQAQDVAEALGIAKRKLVDDRKRGEMLLLGWMSGWSSRAEDCMEIDSYPLTLDKLRKKVDDSRHCERVD